jgi:hypothetical protein
MNTNVHQFYVIPTRAGRQLVTGRDIAVAVTVLALAMGAAGVSEMVRTAPATETQRLTETAPAQQSEFVYFPGQYVNQAMEYEEHIQAF